MELSFCEFWSCSDLGTEIFGGGGLGGGGAGGFADGEEVEVGGGGMISL